MTKLFNFDKTITAGKNFFLADIITDREYKEWFTIPKEPKIYVLDKNRCGNGGTSGFINYAKKNKKGMFCLVPNRSIVQSKEYDPNLCCMYGGNESDTTKPIKIATWDKGLSVIEKIQQWGFTDDVFNPGWKNSLLVIDEYHKLIDDSSYRDVCGKMIELIIKYKLNVILMSATTNIDIVEFFREHSDKTVETTTIDYGSEKEFQIDFCEKGDNKIKDIISNIVSVKEPEDHICFFWNNVANCDKIIFNSKFKEDCELLCSKDQQNNIATFSSGFNKEKHIHFMTSAYFTGHDIDVRVNKAIIIGGNDNSFTAYSASEVKQMLGRFRQGYDSAFVLKTNTKMNGDEYAILKSEYATDKIVWESLPEDCKTDPNFLKFFLEMCVAKQKINCIDGWKSFKTFKSLMAEHNEYVIVEQKIGVACKAKRRKSLSLREFKERVLKGENIDSLDYQYKKICKRYIELKGIEAFKNASRQEMSMEIKLKDATEGNELENLSKEELFDIFFSNGIYDANYITDVMSYIGFEQTGNIEQDVMNCFGCLCVEESNRGGRHSFIILLVKKLVTKNDTPYKDSVTKNLTKSIMSHINVSKCNPIPHNKHIAITAALDDLNAKSLYNIAPVMKYLFEHPDEIAAVKADETYNEQFKSYKERQTMISELYNDTEDRYGHKTCNMDKIDSIIVDIDDSISFLEFKKLYADYSFIAYPSISCTNYPDWNKFRIIFPLANTLKIDNTDLKTLKMLRRAVCSFEDKNHNLGAYVNAEQWDKRFENDGEPIQIDENTTTYFSTFIKTVQEFKDRIYKNGSTSREYWTLDECKEYFINHNEDDKRHKSLFVIKQNMSPDNFEEYRKWLRNEFSERMVKHFDSHKILLTRKK